LGIRGKVVNCEVLTKTRSSSERPKLAAGVWEGGQPPARSPGWGKAASRRAGKLAAIVARRGLGGAGRQGWRWTGIRRASFRRGGGRRRRAPPHLLFVRAARLRLASRGRDGRKGRKGSAAARYWRQNANGPNIRGLRGVLKNFWARFQSRPVPTWTTL
jgi:hypothetical protein